MIMNERFASDLISILFVVIVAALLGFFIGYLLGKKGNKSQIILEDEIETLKQKLAASMKQTAKHAMLFNPALAKDVFKRNVIENDLTIIEGIGKKIESILKDNGIKTWEMLSNYDPVEIKNILLEKGGVNYRIHDPGSWPAQALLAYEGKWEKLKKYQDEITGGRDKSN